jgi:hypothetical protein
VIYSNIIITGFDVQGILFTSKVSATENDTTVRFKVFTAVTILMMFFWVQALCGLVV